MKLRLLTVLAVAGVLALAACGDDDDDTSEATPSDTTAAPAAETTMASEGTDAAAEPGDIVAVASSTDGFSTLVAAIEAAGLVEDVAGTRSVHGVRPAR